jgi:signal transduction histidine kinase
MPEPALGRPRPRPSFAILALLPVGALVMLACTFNAVARIGQVHPGFFLWQNGFVPAIGVIDDAAAHAGLRYQSRLVAVDGRPVADRAAVEALVRTHPVGTTFRYTLAKDGATYDIDLRSTRLGVWTFALTLGNYLLNALALLALGVAIIFLEPTSRPGRSFFLFCANYGLYLATSADLMGPSWFQPLYFFLVTLTPVTALQAALDFPAVPPEIGRLRRWLRPLYAAALALGAASVAAFHRSFPLLLTLDWITHLALGIAGLLALAIIVVALRRPHVPAAEQRLKLLLFGIGGAFLVPVVVLLADYTAGADVPLNYLTLGFAIFPAAMAYAIARHDLFGVDRMIRRAVAYAVVTGLIALVYSAFLAYVDYVALPDMSESPAIHVLVTMLLIAIFNPLRDRIQSVTDVVFFRAPYDYRRTVTTASQALASLLDLDALVARLARIITQEMQVERVEVWLRDADGGAFRREGKPGAPIPATAPMVMALAEGSALHARRGFGGDEHVDPAITDLVALGAVLAVPLILEQRLIGFLAFGEKGSGRSYTTDDLALLGTLANQAAVAVQNARAYRALAETNRELRDARDQLVESERLAAIGELSAAVAHGIRNPVAGIKTAAELAIRDAAPDDPLRESFVDILSEADALDSRISELLDFARPFAPHYAPADLAEVARGSLHLLRRQISEHGVTVTADLPTTLAPHELDDAQIEQVCLALVTNALEAMPAGGTLTVTVAPGPGDDHVLTIRDTGQGIAEEELGKVFRLFYTRKARGTGVGLATVKRIVEGHHGRIEVASTVGHGTEFRVTLPRHPHTRSTRP